MTGGEFDRSGIKKCRCDEAVGTGWGTIVAGVLHESAAGLAVPGPSRTRMTYITDLPYIPRKNVQLYCGKEFPWLPLFVPSLS